MSQMSIVASKIATNLFYFRLFFFYLLFVLFLIILNVELKSELPDLNCVIFFDFSSGNWRNHLHLSLSLGGQSPLTKPFTIIQNFYKLFYVKVNYTEKLLIDNLN